MAAQFLRVKNFEKYQHYKKRNPPWIKLYYELLDDDDFISLTLESRHHYMTLLLIAGRKNNTIPYDLSYLKKVMRLDIEPDLTQLISTGFLLASRKHTASVLKPNLRQNALSETETDISETDISETEPPSPPAVGVVCLSDPFEQFWDAYPKKIGKKAAMRAWEKARDKPPLIDILQALDRAKNSEQWMKENGRFIPHPATWLNQGRWADVVAPKQPSLMEEFLARGKSHDGSRAVLQGVADAHYATMGQALPGPKRVD